MKTDDQSSPRALGGNKEKVSDEQGNQVDYESLSLEQLSADLQDAGVINDEDFSFCVEQLGGQASASTKSVLDTLVRSGQLSSFQVQMIVEGRTHELKFGEYVIVEPIGAGGMGQVFLALHRRMKRRVAIKLLPPAFAEQEESVKRFQREVEVAAQLTHPNIVTAFDAGEVNDLHYLVMEYVDGADLASVVRHSGSLNRDDAIKCVLQAGKGISHAHEAGVIHRDIKPGNLLLGRDGIIKVLDMGLARCLPTQQDLGQSELSATGVVMGSIDYMAPEQAESSRAADQRSDVYSLGCTLFSLMNGRPLHHGETVIEKLVAHRENDAPALVDGDDDGEQRLNNVFMKMVARRPEDRFATVREACQALADCREDSTLDLIVETPIPSADEAPHGSLCETQSVMSELFSTRRHAPDRPEMSKPVRRSRWRAALIVLCILLLVGVAFTIIRLTTPDGTLMVKCLIKGAVIEVNGERKLTIKDPATQSEYQFELRPGKHQVRVMMPDGTELKSESITIRSKGKTLFEASRVPTSSEVAEDNADRRSEDTDPLILTVAKDGSADFRSINKAVDAAQRGMTIRIIDDSVYSGTVRLTIPAKHKDLTIEATGGAAWEPDGGTLSNRRLCLLVSVEGVRIKGIRFLLDKDFDWGAIIMGHAGSTTFVDCTFETEHRYTAGLSIEGLTADPPVVVTNCRFTGLRVGVRISGSDDANRKPVQTRGVLFENNMFKRCLCAASIIGQAKDIAIVGNVFIESKQFAMQFQNLLAGSENLLVANNTFLLCESPIRVWENGGPPVEQVEVSANVSLSSSVVDWWAIDSGGDPSNAKGVGVGVDFINKWTFRNNYREGKRPPDDHQYIRGWMPPSDNDKLLPELTVLSRERSSPDFLRPASDSPLATGGVGIGLPKYVGASATWYAGT